MPLVVLVGHPCSGKTTRAKELQAHLVQQGLEVTLINHDSLSLPRQSMYASNESEKKGRSALKSTLERFLTPSPSKVLLFDYLNNIKGYRYEMWCRAREMSTQQVTLFIDTPVEQCAAWHKERKPEEQYDEKVFVDLCQRMETPNEEKRWDQPLFTITDPSAPLPLEAITDALTKGKPLPVNQSVVPARMEDSNYLFELDRITQSITQAVLEAQADSAAVMVGDAISVPHTKKKVTLARKIHLPELRRLQSQYLKMAKLRTPESLEGIANTFVDHLNLSLNAKTGM